MIGGFIWYRHDLNQNQQAIIAILPLIQPFLPPLHRLLRLCRPLPPPAPWRRGRRPGRRGPSCMRPVVDLSTDTFTPPTSTQSTTILPCRRASVLPHYKTPKKVYEKVNKNMSK
jgi:hypothetical protein